MLLAFQQLFKYRDYLSRIVERHIDKSVGMIIRGWGFSFLDKEIATPYTYSRNVLLAYVYK